MRAKISSKSPTLRADSYAGYYTRIDLDNNLRILFALQKLAKCRFRKNERV